MTHNKRPTLAQYTGQEIDLTQTNNFYTNSSHQFYTNYSKNNSPFFSHSHAKLFTIFVKKNRHLFLIIENFFYIKLNKI